MLILMEILILGIHLRQRYLFRRKIMLFLNAPTLFMQDYIGQVERVLMKYLQ